MIEQVARKNNSPIVRIAEPATCNLQPVTSLIGEHQKINAALALATVEVLQKQIPAGANNLRDGLANVNWPGRLQLIQKPNGQKILLDGAHNLAGAETLRAALEKEFNGSRPVIIFGALADKNWPGICRTLAPLAAKVLTVPVASERTASARELAEVFGAANPQIATTAVENLKTALNASKDEAFIVITGSLYLVGEALELCGLSPENPGERALNEWTPPQN